MPGGRDGAAAKANVFGCLVVPLPYIYMHGRAGSLALLLIGVGIKGVRTWTPNPILFLLGLLPFFLSLATWAFEDLVRLAQ